MNAPFHAMLQIRGVERLSGGQIAGHFFSLHPLTSGEQLTRWLSSYALAGAVAVATFNGFLEGQDAWHHQVGEGEGHRWSSGGWGMGGHQVGGVTGGHQVGHGLMGDHLIDITQCGSQ